MSFCAGQIRITATALIVGALATVSPTVAQTTSKAPIPGHLQPCFPCHSSIVRQYAGDHGMARSLGPVDVLPTTGKVDNPRSGTRYDITRDRDGRSRLTATYADGGRRKQQIVGRIGAGIYDISWVTVEVDVITQQPTDRLFFAPVEEITGRGPTLSPFEQSTRGKTAGMDKPLTAACLRCHTSSDPQELPSAAVAHDLIFPANHLGADAFEHLTPLGCEACHGDPSGHLEIVSDPKILQQPLDDLGIERFSELGVDRRRDVCARCHLDGDTHLDLTAGSFDAHQPLDGQEPSFRLQAENPDDFRFVGQWERLIESPCFQGSPTMTCNTCHEPHRGVGAQGIESFNTACKTCHGMSETPNAEICSRPTELEISSVTGSDARSRDGCVDCHMRRSQPFDLPHVRTSDHYIRRTIPLPEDLPYRKAVGSRGPVEMITAGSLSADLDTPGGRRWLAGVSALAASELGRLDEARGYLADYRQETPSPRLAPLDDLPQFLALQARLAAESRRDPLPFFQRILELQPEEPFTRLTLARRAFDMGDLEAAQRETDRVLKHFPQADFAYFLQVKIAEQRGRPEEARAALEAYVRLWPSDPIAWRKLAELRARDGDGTGARRARIRSQTLRPRH